MREFGVGQSLARTEDWRLVRGQGRYVDDMKLPGEARLYVLRSPHAAARIRGIDTSAAMAAPGVIGVFTGADAVAEGLGHIAPVVRLKRKDGSPSFLTPYGIMAHERVRFVGDVVAGVVAETLNQAKDAAELIAVDYEELPSVTATADAADSEAVVWDEVPDNIAYYSEFGNRAAVDAVFARAHHVAKLDMVISRVAAVTMEPRAVIGEWDAREQRYIAHGTFQSPHNMRTSFASHIFKMPERQFRIVAPDVGGGFGLKNSMHPEYGLAMWAARKLGRPVKWVGERGESFLSDHQARDNVAHVELALDRDGRFLGLRIANTVNMGAYLAPNGVICGVNHVGQLSGVYTTPAIFAEITAVFTHTTPTCPYRGAGRPETAYMVERIIDVAAHEMGFDPHELRKRNLIPAEAMPYKTGFLWIYDSGEFEKNQDMTAKMADWAGFEKRRREARGRGKLRGIGMAHVLEKAGGSLDEAAEIRFDPAGGVTLFVGTHNHGQGHETTFRQILVEYLGVEPESVRVSYGDTDAVFFGRGTFGSRSMIVGGAAVLAASKKIIERGKTVAGRMLEAAVEDIEFDDGRFIVAGTDRSVTIAAVAKASFAVMTPQKEEAGLAERAHTFVDDVTYPNGCHICEVEIDPETGVTEIVGYWVTDDVGTLINPMIVKGQLHGGIVQGVGQILWENVAYDPDGGQNMSGSFMDYGIARAHSVPFFEIKSNEVPSLNNPLGVKGAGEAGAVGGLPAAMNAIVNAVQPLGITTLDMPVTPTRLWDAIRNAPKPLESQRAGN